MRWMQSWRIWLAAGLVMLSSESLFAQATTAGVEAREAVPITLALDAPAEGGAATTAGAAGAPSGDRGVAFREGSWTFQSYLAGTVSGYQGDVYAWKTGVGYHFFDGFSLNAEAAAYYLDIDANNGDPAGEAGGGGLDLLVRYHFLRGRDWSVYGDLGAGFIESSKSFPADGTNFNFTPQAGLGVTWRLIDQWRLMAGARWFHISNARLHGIERNPAFDGLQLYAGAMLPF